MRKSAFVLAVMAAAFSSVAFAGEVKTDATHAPVVKATTMSDADMDKVTAGDAGGNDHGNGHAWGFGQIANPANGVNHGNGPR